MSSPMQKQYKSGDFIQHAKSRATAQLLTKERSSSYWIVDLHPFSGDPCTPAEHKACWHEEDFAMAEAAGQPNPMHKQVGGDHYKNMAIQPAEFIHKNDIGFIEGSVITYLCRWRDKGGIQDIEKAIHMLEMLVAMENDKAASEAKDRLMKRDCAPGAQSQESAWKIGGFQPGDKVIVKTPQYRDVTGKLLRRINEARYSVLVEGWGEVERDESELEKIAAVEREPMFKVGDRVRMHGTGGLGSITAQVTTDLWRVRFDGFEKAIMVNQSEFSLEKSATDIDASKPK